MSVLWAELKDGQIYCGLNKCDKVAIDYIVQPVGKDDKVEIELIIPVCSECVTHIGHFEWVLLYCIHCNSSQWIYKPLARRVYKEDESIIWMNDCPKCYNK